MWADIVQGNYLYNLESLLTDKFFKKNNIHNVLFIKLGQHCTETSHTQCYPSMCETTLHKKITCTMLAQSAQIYFSRYKFYPITISRNNLRTFCLMLAWEFIYGLWDNNEQGPTLTRTIL